ncbi:Zinc finger protein CONSTANS-like [Sarracenia purpurea var. burkii]
MGYICDFCGEQRSVVYCRSDAACLCLSCDSNVHSANALSRRHFRTLVCEKCNSQPAFVRCLEERISLCQTCDSLEHTGLASASTHQKEAVNCYSGCPSAAELSTIWPFVLDFPSMGDSTCVQEMNSMNITERILTNCGDPLQGNNGQDVSVSAEVNNVKDSGNSSVLMGSSSMLQMNIVPKNVDQPVELANSTSSKVCCPGTKVPDFCKDDFYEDFYMDEVDLNVENYEELFGVALNDPEQLFGNDGIDSLFGVKGLFGTDLNYQGTHAAEGSSVNTMQPACSNTTSADSVMSSKTEPNLSFAWQAHLSLSFSGLTGESSAGDYQDCDASSMPLVEEPQWCSPPCPESSFASIRSNAVMRYREKKKSRKYGKKVRYASRKARADVSTRVKGRFVKAGNAYDYNPLSGNSRCS